MKLCIKGVAFYPELALYNGQMLHPLRFFVARQCPIYGKQQGANAALAQTFASQR